MKTKLLLTSLVVLFFSHYNYAQDITLKKGVIIDSLNIINVEGETFALYLPKNYENKGTWPLFVAIDVNGKGAEVITKFRAAAEEHNYVLIAPNTLKDTIGLDENVKKIGRAINTGTGLFNINSSRIYVGGFDAGARLANVIPIIYNSVSGVLACGATFANTELITRKNPFHFIGIVGKEDFTYTEILETEKLLNRLKFDNNILSFNGGKEWPSLELLSKGFQYFTLRAMARDFATKDSTFISSSFLNDFNAVASLEREGKKLMAYRALIEMQNAYRDLKPIDSIENRIKALKKDKDFRQLNRNQEAAFFKEEFLKEDYQFALEDDILTYNYNNLGWWNYQIKELQKFVNGKTLAEQQMGKRLIGFINAIVADQIDLFKANAEVDDEAVILLSMLKTIVAPKDYNYYLDVIALSSKYEEYGTAIFYLEELLKNGFKDKDKLYNLEHTALLRIMPEYNDLIAEYLTDARYEIKEE
ncbi:hypothetical protein GCM10011414_19930 [Croceivirga lutea]|uniref:alpha/beta hydrolase n=1 Tax=Croceivirga lutea TaxID=1775167 RepID=UPI0016397134|nr:alpha/beta hydrolase [Croceivirga lutea]GGG50264.1 hypothetical protein GCM10011414_19930 [Croceivirga lutea]